MAGRLEGLVALVTGAGRGLGRAMAVAYGREGARVALTGRTREDLESTAAEMGGETLVYPGDVRDPDAVAALVGAVVEQLRGARRTGQQCGSGLRPAHGGVGARRSGSE